MLIIDGFRQVLASSWTPLWHEPLCSGHADPAQRVVLRFFVLPREPKFRPWPGREFRWEAFNVFNTQQFVNAPDRNVKGSPPGRFLNQDFTGTRSIRTMWLQLKFISLRSEARTAFEDVRDRNPFIGLSLREANAAQ